MNQNWYGAIVIMVPIFIFLLGVIVTMVGFYAKSLGHRVDLLEEAHKNLNDLVLSQYHNKDEIKDLLGEIKSRIESLHTRFDMILTNNKE